MSVKDKIRQILRQFRSTPKREETSGFDPKMLKVLYQYMNFLTKDYVWYYDTPEQSFKWSPGSIWLINPETKEWVLELEKDGTLWLNGGFYINFRKYFNMERPDYERFIYVWLEDVLNRGVSATRSVLYDRDTGLEDVLSRGKQMK